MSGPWGGDAKHGSVLTIASAGSRICHDKRASAHRRSLLRCGVGHGLPSPRLILSTYAIVKICCCDAKNELATVGIAANRNVPFRHPLLDFRPAHRGRPFFWPRDDVSERSGRREDALRSMCALRTPKALRSAGPDPEFPRGQAIRFRNARSVARFLRGYGRIDPVSMNRWCHDRDSPGSDGACLPNEPFSARS